MRPVFRSTRRGYHIWTTGRNQPQPALAPDSLEGANRGCSMMASGSKTFVPFPHDWHSTDYVSEWIEHDVARDLERRPLLRQMLSSAPFARDCRVQVLDVGAGYGVVAEEVL